MARPTVALIAVAALALIGVGSARAADFFVLAPNDAAPGDRVTVTFGAAGSETIPVRFRLFLVENAVAPEVRSTADPRLIALGVIEVGAHGDGSLTFVVPETAAGAYVLAHERIGPCPHSGTCGPSFRSVPIDEHNTVAQYRDAMILNVRDQGSSVFAEPAWLLLALIAVGVPSAAVLGVIRRRRARNRVTAPGEASSV